MVSNYVKIIKQLEDGIFSYIDEFEDEDFIFGCVLQDLNLKLMII